jgi:hypothetical protein
MNEFVLEIDLDLLDSFVHNQDFHYYLVNNVADFNTAAFILQTLMDTVEKLKCQLNDEET